MRVKLSNVLFVLLVLALCTVGAGFYRGWFVLSSQSADSESKKVRVNLTVDPDKVKGDAETVERKAAELAERATDRAKGIGSHAGGNAKADAD
jgi:hypothetical protein